MTSQSSICFSFWDTTWCETASFFFFFFFLNHPFLFMCNSKSCCCSRCPRISGSGRNLNPQDKVSAQHLNVAQVIVIRDPPPQMIFPVSHCRFFPPHLISISFICATFCAYMVNGLRLYPKAPHNGPATRPVGGNLGSNVLPKDTSTLTKWF